MSNNTHERFGGFAKLKNIEDQYFEDLVNEVIVATKFSDSKAFMHHGKTSVYEHSIQVAYKSYIIAKKMNFTKNLRSLVVGALLHDYFLYDWHDRLNGVRLHGFKHPFTALRNVKAELEIDDITEDIIVKHMFPMTIIPPIYTESWIVTIVDKVCAINELAYIGKIKKVLKRMVLIKKGTLS